MFEVPSSRAKGTRADLVVAALVHPGFAHVPIASLRAGLCSYLRRCEGEDEIPIDWSNPTMRAFAMSYLGGKYGVTCALCGALRTTPGFKTDHGFVRWVVGDHEAAYLPLFRTHPICDPCSPGTWSFQPKGGLPWEDRYAAHLCYLYSWWSFRERVKANAKRFQALRFDPRRIPLCEAA